MPVRVRGAPSSTRNPYILSCVKLVMLLALFAAASLNAQVGGAEDREAGARIFRSHCAPCHGIKGAGGTGPDLTSGRFFHGSSDDELYNNISNGIAGTEMPSQFFNGKQVWQIVTFVRSLSQQNSTAALHGNPSHGQQLVSQRGCLTCHLVRGEGGTRGPDLSVIGSQRSANYLRESLVDPSAHVAYQFRVAKIVGKDKSQYTGFLMNQDTYQVQLLDFDRGLTTISRDAIADYGVEAGSMMPSYKDKLSASELDDVVSYLASLQRGKEAQ
ncbi:MAG TPA: c-type cytochrome [Bryobacteraceae bacterium]|nr:c-type cytochrome [Bryobacteraceae bacterium]